MSEIRKSLFLLDPIYGLVTESKNLLYDLGLAKAWKPEVRSICVGNLSVGGTGKTPHIEYLIEKLQQHFNLVVLSRGYGRSSSGLVHSNQNKSAEWLGDEPSQIHFKYPNVPVVCSSSRREGFEFIQKKNLGNLVLMDDGFQHRSVQADLYILLTSEEQPFWHDHYLPSGDLREGQKNQKRADCVVVTKCNPFPDSERIEATKGRLKRKEVFFSSLEYSSSSILEIDEQYLLITGIANPNPLLKKLQGMGISYEHLMYSDHHKFSATDVHFWNERLIGKNRILTTEKDLERMRPFLSSLNGSLETISIKVNFANRQFDDWLDEKIEAWTKA